MAERVDLYGSYRNFTDPVLEAIRKETYGNDIGQNSWLTVDEYGRWLPLLDLSAERHVLEVASGSGGPALHVARSTGCRITGVDADDGAVATATELAERAGLADRVVFRAADATARLPFADASFDAIVCIDAMNHLPNRGDVLREWRRVLRPGRRALFTDPVVIAGLVTGEELAVRGSIGHFVFTSAAHNERLVEEAGLALVEAEDTSAHAAEVAGRWRDARAAHRRELVVSEGAERFEGLQRFFDTVQRLTAERRLQRIAYVVQAR